MPRRWQYQEKVQPVVTPPNTAETVHPEAWMQPPTPPQRNWALRAAAFAIVLAAASSGSQRNFDVKDYPGNGNWRPAYTDIVPRTSQWNYYATLSASSGQAVSDPEQATEPEEPFVDKFGQPPPSIHLRRRNYGVCSGSTFVPPVPLFLDKWFEPPSQPTYSKRAVDLIQTIAPVTVPVTETVTIDKWFEPPSQPLKQPYPFDLFTVPGHQQAFAYIHGYEDHWHPNYPAWLARVRRGLSSGSAYVGLISESVTLDKWYAPPSQPTYLPKRTGAEQGQSVTDTKLLTQQEQVTISRFKATYPDWLPRPYSEATYVASGYTGPVVVSEVVTIDKWWQPTSQPIYLKRCPVLDQDVTDSRLLTQQESVSISKWGQPAPEVARRRRYGVNSGSAFVGLISETVTLDKWFSPASQPLFQPSRIPSLVPEPAFVQVVAAGAEVVTLDKWWHEQPDPVRPPYPYDLFTVPGHQQAFATLHGAYSPMYADYPSQSQKPFPAHIYGVAASFIPVVPTEVVLADKWLPDYPVWLTHAYVQPASGAVMPVSTAQESVSIDKFKATYPDSIARVSPSSALIASGVVRVPGTIFSGEIILLDKWFAPASQPTYLPKRSAQLDQDVIDPKLLTQHEALSIDKFNPTYPERVPRVWPVATYTSGPTLVMVPPPETILLDKWWQLTAQPTYLPKRSAELGQSVIDSKALTQKEFVSIDRFGPTYLERITRVWPVATFASGSVLVMVPPAEVVTLDKWFEPASIPTRLLARTTDLTQTIIPPPEIIRLDKWWAPPSQPTYLAKRCADLQQLVIDPKPETIRLDKWAPDYQAWVNRPFNSAVQAASGQTLVLTEIVRLEKWWQPTSQPTYLAKRSPALGHVVIDAGALLKPETVSVDKFGPDYPNWIDRRFNSAIQQAAGEVLVILPISPKGELRALAIEIVPALVTRGTIEIVPALNASTIEIEPALGADDIEGA